MIRDFLHLESAVVVPPSLPDLPSRPPVLCPGCPHRASFYLIRRVFGKKTIYASDIGCYTLGYGAPLHSGDLVLCMGASITMAAGIARLTGQRTVAYIGDSTFFHSGLPALINAVQNNDEQVLRRLTRRLVVDDLIDLVRYPCGSFVTIYRYCSFTHT